jgi:uncharacterized protein
MIAGPVREVREALIDRCSGHRGNGVDKFFTAKKPIAAISVALDKKMPLALFGSLSLKEGQNVGERVVAYAAFFLIGLILLRAHWHWLFDLDSSGAVQFYGEIMLGVPPLAILGCWLGARVKDPVLRVLVVATAVVVIFQVVLELTNLPSIGVDVINGFDRAYAFLCLIAVPVSLTTRGWRPAAFAFIGLVAVSVPLSIAWQWDRQELVWHEPVAAGPKEYALFAAAQAGDLERVRNLLLSGAGVDAEDGGGRQVLIYAADGGSAELVRLLIAHGANVDAEEKFVGIRCADAAEAPDCRTFFSTHGMTPLMVAARSGNIDVVRELLKAGANPTLKDVRGRTARQLALEFGHDEVARALE